MQARSLRRLREMTDEELVAAHDSLLTTKAVGIDYYLSELARRDADRQTSTMVFLTRVITGLTVVNVAAVIYSIAN